MRGFLRTSKELCKAMISIKEEKRIRWRVPGARASGRIKPLLGHQRQRRARWGLRRRESRELYTNAPETIQINKAANNVGAKKRRSRPPCAVRLLGTSEAQTAAAAAENSQGWG